MSVGQVSVSKLSGDQMSVCQMSVGRMSVGQMSVSQMSTIQTYMIKMHVNQMVIDRKSWNKILPFARLSKSLAPRPPPPMPHWLTMWKSSFDKLINDCQAFNIKKNVTRLFLASLSSLD